MRSHHLRIAITALFAIVCHTSSVRTNAQNVAGAPRYIIIDLGVKAPLTNSAGYALNASGLVAGDQFDGLGAALGFYTDAKGAMHSLGTLRTDKTGTSEATGINNAGWVVGQASTDSGQFHAFRFNSVSAGSAMIDLTPGLYSSSAQAINQFNEVVGSVSDTGSGLFAFLYTPVPVNPLTYLTDATRKASAFGIADDAKVVGQLATSSANTSYNAFLTDSHGAGPVTNLSTLGGANSTAYGLNVSDQVVGSSAIGTKSPIYTHAFRTAVGGYPMDATSDLGLLTGKGYTGKNSYAYGINAAGQVVGSAEVTAAPVLLHAFLYDDINGMQDLNALIPTSNPPLWVLTSAQGINDNDDIVGFGTIGGVVHAFELVRNPVAAMVVGPTPFYGGGTATGTVVLQQPAPAGGAKVTLSSTNALLQVPPTVTVAVGTTVATFAVTGKGAGAIPTPVTITGVYNGGTASATIGVTPTVVSTLSIGATSMNSGDTALATLVLNAPAPPGGLKVTLANPASTALTVPATVTVLAGQVSQQFTVTDIAYPAKGNLSVTITATPGTTVLGATATVTVLAAPTITGLTLSPATVNGGNGTIGTITLGRPAPAGGITIPLKSVPAGVASPDPTCNIAAGAVSGQFNVSTAVVSASTPATLTATYPANKLTTVALHVQPTVSPTGKNNTLFINPNYLPSGGSATATLTGTTTISGGEYATITTSDPSVTAPSSVYLPQGLNTVTFPVSTVPVAQQRLVTITVSYSGGTVSTKLTLLPTTLAALTIAPASLIGGAQVATGTITLTGPSPAALGGLYVNLFSSDASAPVPATLYIAPNQTSGTFTVAPGMTPAVTIASITAQYNGTKLAQKLTIQPIKIASLTLSSPVVTAGVQVTTGTVTLSAPSPAALGGLYVNLSSSDVSAPVPATLYISPNQTSGTFTISTVVGSAATVTIAASLGASAPQTATLIVSPITVAALVLSSDSGYGSVDTVTGTVILNAPSPAASGGLYVYLFSSDAAAPVPATLYISPGLTSATFPIAPTLVAAPVPVSIAVSLAGPIQAQLLSVLPCQLQRLTLDHSSIAAGGTATATLLLSHVAGGSGQYVNLYADDPTVTVPTSIYVNPGAASVTFTVTAGLVPGISPVTIIAYNGDVETSVQLTVH